MRPVFCGDREIEEKGYLDETVGEKEPIGLDH